MPDTDQKDLTLEELTTEQKQSTDPNYLDAVNKAVDEGLQQINEGQGIPADRVWKELGLEN